MRRIVTVSHLLAGLLLAGCAGGTMPVRGNPHSANDIRAREAQQQQLQMRQVTKTANNVAVVGVTSSVPSHAAAVTANFPGPNGASHATAAGGHAGGH